MFSADDHRYMAKAMRLAGKGLYTTDPNPRVGCVLVKGNDVVGEGWHVRAGEGHAEVHALQDAAEQARGATAYVTLEPCSHHGRTPPCCEALIDAGVSRVVVAMQDPNLRVAGQGLARLQQAGIEVESGLMQTQAEAINPGFLMRMREGRPYVRCKLAMSLDGRTAMASGESQWITAEASRNDVHRLRARSSAIVTGIGTVMHDDPSLTVRLPGDKGQYGNPPLRVVLDSRLQMSPQAKMLSEAGPTRILTLDAETPQAGALREAGAEVAAVVAARDSKIDLVAMLKQLADDDRNEVLLEAGATLSGAMLQAGLVDELVVYMAPILMGDTARGLLHLPGMEKMADRFDLEIIDIRAVGRDWRITAKPVYRPV
jgi:diaminohydroxyphosphoribosylaminopyrimidine deaminase/5-amino-6-(5-phosphoribosylamino)uracil reductase